MLNTYKYSYCITFSEHRKYNKKSAKWTKYMEKEEKIYPYIENMRFDVVWKQRFGIF